jgi:hypothetical protein
MSDENYRAYFFNNMYLTGIHAGIQAQHCTAEMFNKYPSEESGVYEWGTQEEVLEFEREVEVGCHLYDWASEDKTTIILNGGYASNLILIESLFEDVDNPYPWATFRESKDALNGCITSVGIILPERVYNFNRDCGLWIDNGGEPSEFTDRFTDYELLLADCVSSCRLMS